MPNSARYISKNTVMLTWAALMLADFSIATRYHSPFLMVGLIIFQGFSIPIFVKWYNK